MIEEKAYRILYKNRNWQTGTINQRLGRTMVKTNNR